MQSISVSNSAEKNTNLSTSLLNNSPKVILRGVRKVTLLEDP